MRRVEFSPCLPTRGKAVPAEPDWLHEIAVAQRLLGVLIDRNGDRLDMLEAMAFMRCELPQFGQRIEPGRVVRLFVVPFQLFAHCHSDPSLPSGWCGQAHRLGALARRKAEAA
jgi:hypothetical protein